MVREMQIEITMACSFLLRLAKNKKLITIYCLQRYKETGPQIYISWKCAILQYLWKDLDSNLLVAIKIFKCIYC